MVGKIAHELVTSFHSVHCHDFICNHYFTTLSLQLSRGFLLPLFFRFNFERQVFGIRCLEHLIVLIQVLWPASTSFESIEEAGLLCFLLFFIILFCRRRVWVKFTLVSVRNDGLCVNFSETSRWLFLLALFNRLIWILRFFPKSSASLYWLFFLVVFSLVFRAQIFLSALIGFLL